MRILTENLESALILAIELAKIRGLSESAFAAGLREVLEAIKRGEHIEVVDK